MRTKTKIRPMNTGELQPVVLRVFWEEIKIDEYESQRTSSPSLD